MKKPEQFATEADLCTAFMAEVRRDDVWVCYPETESWDILLIRRKDGYQCGVQAKLKFNAKVLLQACEGKWEQALGPDYRAILVPAGSANDLAALAPKCGVTVITMRLPNERYSPAFWPHLPLAPPSYDDGDSWFERLPMKRYRVPEYVPDVAAGASAPLQLTRWKVTAIRLDVLLHHTGFLTRDDFKAQGVDIRRWIDGNGWLLPSSGGFVRGPNLPDFRRQHPEVWLQIEAEPAKWRRQQPLMVVAKKPAELPLASDATPSQIPPPLPR